MREREEGGMKRDERTKRYSAPVEGISGHYFLQYFNVKSSGFLEPSYRFLQEKPSGRSRPVERKGVCVPDGSMRGGRVARGREETAAPRGAFPAMQSLKGEPRHYAVAAVHGPLPHHPSIPPLPSLLFFSSFNSPYRFPVRPLSLFSALPDQRSCFSYFIGEKASPPYIPTPMAYGTLSIRSRSNDT